MHAAQKQREGGEPRAHEDPRCTVTAPGEQTQPHPREALASTPLLPVPPKPHLPEGERDQKKPFSMLTGVMCSKSAYTLGWSLMEHL